ncbi:hypothetical protein MKX01_011070 [Papaver californicum]|nr:hypothetical protein MKX01_011070 [Papaver californicum]
MYESNINSLLTSLVNSATYSTQKKFTIMGASSQDTASGLYQCRGDLSLPYCTNCVARAVSQIGTLCSNAYGGALELQGCFVKYDNTKFLGVEDKTVMLKKCGPAIGDSDLLGRIDALMDGLGSGGGPYKVGGLGKIQGMAHVTGDLSLSEYQNCVDFAIQELKSNCAKCYARYSTGGVDDQYKAGISSSSSGKLISNIRYFLFLHRIKLQHNLFNWRSMDVYAENLIMSPFFCRCFSFFFSFNFPNHLFQ